MPLLDFLFPKYSLLEREGEWITKSELAHLVSHPRIFNERELRKLGMPSLDRVLAVSTYSDTPLLRKAISTFKYRGVQEVGSVLERLLAESFLKHLNVRRDSCICSVPLHWSRQFKRGFNQAEVLARGLARETKLPFQRLLTRTRPTGKQTLRRRREERRGAMKNAFRFAGSRARCPFYCVYLIDDLFTTGATMEECARVLKDAGVRRVEGVVLAHG